MFMKTANNLVQNVLRDISFYYSHAEISKMWPSESKNEQKME